MSTYSLALHGGAGTITRASLTEEKEKAYTAALLAALTLGESVLKKGGTAMDAVTQTIISLEDCPLFNAGKGAVFTADGLHEMDAAIMRGENLEAGAVAGVQLIKNPILLAKEIMEHSDHVLLSGRGAEEFAKQQKLIFETEEYFFDEYRFQQLREAIHEGKIVLDHTETTENKKFGTVGAVAKDVHGNLAAGTSTGGMTNKKFNRIGDSPIIGSGTYANNATCAISCTGHGEYFIRAVVAYDVSCLMEYKGLSLQAACEVVVMDKLVKLGGEGGLIAVDAAGNISLVFNSEGMYRAWNEKNTANNIAIYR
ncbi:MAG: isoaspartyl peptidase/L-asparaginase [Bacteroidia bacterium]|nr:isoaspartyl peptidase/L-asparaginase [Bacteroidia bacterium]MBP7244144.1 isoaspartyl peptidase/L-asparaginase [Bacteroidia bacterium]